jgi:hypothetical protein
MIGHSPVTCVAPSKAKHTFIATVSISDIPRVYQQYPNCIDCIVIEEAEKFDDDAPTPVSVYLHNKAIDWDSSNFTESDGIYIYDLAPKYQQPSQLAAATEIKATRARRTKAEIEAAKEAAKTVEPVLPDFCTNGQECNLPVAPAPAFEAVEPETPEVISSAATTTKARRFGRTVASVEAETTDDSGSEVA